MTMKNLNPEDPLKIAWLTTGRGPGSYDALAHLIEEIEKGLPVQIAVVFCNRERGESVATDRLLNLVQAKGIPLETISSVQFRRSSGGDRSVSGGPLPEWRQDFDKQVGDHLEEYNFSLVVLFGYMLIVTESLFSRFPLLNDHPALPDGPTGTYQQVITELILKNSKESGCMYHFVTEQVDRGPVVTFCRFEIPIDSSLPLPENPTQEQIESHPLYGQIRELGLVRERALLTETLRAFGSGQLSVKSIKALDLTNEIDRLIGL